MDIYLKLFYLMSVPAIISADTKVEVSTTQKAIPDAGHLLLDFNWPRPKNGVQRYPHLVSCKHFYSVEPNNRYKLRKCPTGLVFDFVSLTCKRKTLSQCWSSQFGHDYKPFNFAKHFHCPVPWRNYSDVLDCRKYFHCHGVQGVHRRCPRFTLFDKVTRRCVLQHKAVCSGARGKIERHYKCPRAWGLFPYSRDCSKYHKCTRKIPVLRKCGVGYLFNATNRRCQPNSEVDCGHRYNPYAEEMTASPLPEIPSEGPEDVLNAESQEISMELVFEFPNGTFEDHLENTNSDEISNGSDEILTSNESQEKFTKTAQSVTASAFEKNITRNTKTETDSGIPSETSDIKVSREIPAGYIKVTGSEENRTEMPRDISTDSSLSFNQATGSPTISQSQETIVKTSEVVNDSSSNDILTENPPTDVTVNPTKNIPTETHNEAFNSRSKEIATKRHTDVMDISTQEIYNGTFTDGVIASSRKNATEETRIMTTQEISTGTAKVVSGSSSEKVLNEILENVIDDEFVKNPTKANDVFDDGVSKNATSVTTLSWDF